MAIVKLGNVSVINIGLTPSTFNKDFWNIKNQILFPFIKGSLNIEGYITQKAISSNSAKLADKNTIILSIFGKFESIWLNEKVSFNQQTANIYSNNNEILINKYLYYWLIKKKEILTLNSIGTVAKHLNKSILSNISIFIPNVEIQNKIISIIEPFEKLKNNFESIKKYLIKFSELIFNLINNFIKLEYISRIRAGSSPPQRKEYWINGNIKYLNIENLTNNIYINDSEVHLNILGFKKYNCLPTSKYSILIGKVSPDKNKISLVDENFVVNGAIRIVDLLDIKNYFQIFFSIRNSAFILKNLATGSVQQQINSDKLRSLKIKFNKEYNIIFNAIGLYLKSSIKIINKADLIIKKLIHFLIKN